MKTLPDPVLTKRDIERFWSKVDRRGTDECWPWTTRSTDGHGYGIFSIGGFRKAKMYKAHRLAYLIEHGSIPAGLGVLHSCDNPPCCNPAHLRPGSQADNMRDVVVRVRGNKGEKNGKAKLTTLQVAEIRSMRGIIRQRELANKYKVSRTTISAVVCGYNWGA